MYDDQVGAIRASALTKILRSPQQSIYGEYQGLAMMVRSGFEEAERAATEIKNEGDRPESSEVHLSGKAQWWRFWK
jgi:hypothetical protein